MRKTEEDQGAKLVRYGIAVLIGGVGALGACFAFLLLASLAISRGLVGEELMYQLTIVCCVLGSFVGALWAVRRCGSRGLLVGLGVGAVLFLLLLTIGLLFFDTPLLDGSGIGLLCGALCGGAAAGLLGSRTKGSAKKKRRK